MQVVAGAVGAAVGFVASGFNPYGAYAGYMVGSSLYAAVNPVNTTVQGAKIGDISTQTSEEGVACPIIWGRVRPIAGNLIATSEPRIVEERTKQSSGKGGGGSATTVTEHVYRSYAIRICEGPAACVRAWRNNELVYDARFIGWTDAEKTTYVTNLVSNGKGVGYAQDIVDWGSENNETFLKYGKFYTGTWTQNPDSTLESIFGSGNVPAHRGIAYMVVTSELLDDTSGAVPQWLFEMERPEGMVVTSRPYAVEVVEGAASKSITNVRAAPVLYPDDFTKSSGVALVSATMRDTSKQALTPNENTSQSLGTTLIDAQLIYVPTIPPGTYSDTTQSATSSGVSLTSASMQDKLITYGNDAVKSTKSNGVTLVSGSLTQ